MKLFNKIKSLFKSNGNIQKFTINSRMHKHGGAIYIYDNSQWDLKNINYDRDGYEHQVSFKINDIETLQFNQLLDINQICKLIDTHKDDINVLNRIGGYIHTNKKKFSLVHLNFMCEYLRDKIKECNKKSIFDYE